MAGNICTETSNEYPQLSAYKGLQDTLAALWNKYPVGQAGWFAFVTEVSTIAWWNPQSQAWEIIESKNFEAIQPNQLSDGDSYVWDSEKKLFTIVSLNLWATEEY